MKTNSKEAQDLIAAVKGCMALSTKEMAPKLDAAGITDPDSRAANVLQNVMRLALEAGLNECLGFTTALPMDMAVRLASYALSALPMDMQADATLWVIETLPTVHAHRMQHGTAIATQWASDPTGTVQ